MRHLLLTPVVATGFHAVAIAQNDTSTATSPVPSVKEKKICRSEADVGSIMQRRTCHTRAEWATIDAANEADADRYRARPRNNNRQLTD